MKVTTWIGTALIGLGLASCGGDSNNGPLGSLPGGTSTGGSGRSQVTGSGGNTISGTQFSREITSDENFLNKFEDVLQDIQPAQVPDGIPLSQTS